MKNRDFVLLLIVLAIGLFLWQLIQKVNKGLETVSQTDRAGADLLTAKVDEVSTSTADLSVKVEQVAEPLQVYNYASAYNSYKQ